MNYTYDSNYDVTYHIYDTDAPLDCGCSLLDTIKEAFPQRKFNMNRNGNLLTIDMDEELSVGDEETLDQLISTYKTDCYSRLLHSVKHIKITEIRDKNSILESAGFEFPAESGQKFDLRVYSKTAWIGMSVADFYHFLPYPQPVRNIEEEIYYIDSSVTMAYFFAAGLLRQKYIFDSAAYLIVDVLACTTVEQVNAIIDNRQ